MYHGGMSKTKKKMKSPKKGKMTGMKKMAKAVNRKGLKKRTPYSG
tara:strand:+ start:414 stop:548 length:135 start_codon:yes stop_codon:yes gene_type:complete